MQETGHDFLEFGRRHLGPVLELLLGWILLVYGGLRLFGRVQMGRQGRHLRGGAALVAGGLLLWDACARFQ